MNPANVPSSVRESLLDRFDGDSEQLNTFIRENDPKEIFKAYCDYEGLIGWGCLLWDNCVELQADEK